MNKCQSKSEINESVAFNNEAQHFPAIKKRKKKKKGVVVVVVQKNIMKKTPDKCVIVHNKEPLRVWDVAAQKPLKDCEGFPTVACRQRHAINRMARTT